MAPTSGHFANGYWNRFPSHIFTFLKAAQKPSTTTMYYRKM